MALSTLYSQPYTLNFKLTLSIFILQSYNKFRHKTSENAISFAVFCVSGCNCLVIR